MKTDRTQVLVVGAGPVGLMTALLLEHGVPTSAGIPHSALRIPHSNEKGPL
jgi:threonine dehydrogenase-like Zn-dependent dehydrogenase